MMNTDNNINIEDMRSAWQGFCVAEPQQFNPAKKTEILNHRSKLLRQQKVIVAVGLVWAVFSMPVLCLNPTINFPIWAGAYLSLYFAVLAILAMIQYYAYKDIDMCTMSVRECLGAVLKAKTLRLKINIAGYIIATPTLAYMLWFFYHLNTITFIGAVSGAVIGLFLGVMIEIRMRRHLRQMSRYLSSLTHD